MKNSQDIFLLVALAFIIFMMFFNGRKRKKAQAEMQAGIKTGAYVLLHSGILGTIISQDDKSLVIETTPGTKLTVVKGAVRSIEEAPKKTAAAKPAAAKSTTASKTAAKPAAKKPVAKKPAAKPAK
jgi:preprotein translocase subunit YajC